VGSTRSAVKVDPDRLPHPGTAPRDEIRQLRARSTRSTKLDPPSPRVRFLSKVVIRNFAFSQGDRRGSGKAACRPRYHRARAHIREPGNPLTVRFHTVTACKAPCNRGSASASVGGWQTGCSDSVSSASPDSQLAALMPNGDNGVASPRWSTRPPPRLTARRQRPGKVLQAGCVGSVTWKTPRAWRQAPTTYFCRSPFNARLVLGSSEEDRQGLDNARRGGGCSAASGSAWQRRLVPRPATDARFAEERVSQATGAPGRG